MCISAKILDMYLMFISTHMVLKEKFGVINVYICKNIGHVVPNVYLPIWFWKKNLVYLCLFILTLFKGIPSMVIEKKNAFSKSLQFVNKINVLQENALEELLAHKQEHGFDIRSTLITSNGLDYYYFSPSHSIW